MRHVSRDHPAVEVLARNAVRDGRLAQRGPLLVRLFGDLGRFQGVAHFQALPALVHEFAKLAPGLDREGDLFDEGIGRDGLGDDVVRAESLKGLEVFGVRLDAEKNSVRSKEARCISTPDSSVKVFVIPTNEELAIAREVANVLRG